LFQHFISLLKLRWYDYRSIEISISYYYPIEDDRLWGHSSKASFDKNISDYICVGVNYFFGSSLRKFHVVPAVKMATENETQYHVQQAIFRDNHCIFG
jgi:hypothetical protein